jgi:hypothetical protein
MKKFARKWTIFWPVTTNALFGFVKKTSQSLKICYIPFLHKPTPMGVWAFHYVMKKE